MGLVVVNKLASKVDGASCPNPMPFTAFSMEKTRAKRQDLPHFEPSSLALVSVKGPATGRSRPARDLTTDISGRIQDRLLETIEVSCSSAREGHPEGHQIEIVGENPSDPVLVQDEDSPEGIQPVVNDEGPAPREKPHNNDSIGGNPADDAACTFASPFSYAELGEMLKQIPPGLDVALPSAKMLETTKMV